MSQTDLLESMHSSEIMAVLDPGAMFGESALLDNRPRAATVRALGFCDFQVLSVDDFEEVSAPFRKTFRTVLGRRL